MLNFGEKMRPICRHIRYFLDFHGAFVVIKGVFFGKFRDTKKFFFSKYQTIHIK